MSRVKHTQIQSSTLNKIMSRLSYHLMLFVLVLAFSLSPVQNVIAAVSSCMTTKHTMQINNHAKMSQHMKMSDNGVHHHMQKSGTQHDCCDDNKSCHTFHCASVTAAILISTPTIDVNHSVNSIYQNLKISLVSNYSSSLFRPPKV